MDPTEKQIRWRKATHMVLRPPEKHMGQHAGYLIEIAPKPIPATAPELTPGPAGTGTLGTLGLRVSSVCTGSRSS